MNPVESSVGKNLLSLVHRNGLWLSWPVIVLGIVLLAYSIISALRLAGKYRLHSLPLTAEQPVEFDRPGRVVLWLEGPILSSRFSGLSFQLTTSEGTVVGSRRTLGSRPTSSFTRSRSPHRVFHIRQPGTYTLRTLGLGAPQLEDENHQLVFLRPHMPQTVLCILGMILGASLAIGGLVNFLLRLMKNG